MGLLPSFGRGALCACVLALCVGGCGRRGALEPPPGASVVRAPGTAVPGIGALPGNAQNLSEGGFQDAGGDPGLIQSPNYVYERSAIAKLNAAASGPAPRPINAPPAPQPSSFILDPLVR